jgi:hypothetical protein
MTIKQQGGIFGRNPTFNDVTIEGNLIINGEIFTGLDFQGSWNASTNTPTLSSGTGTQGEFYIVSVAGTTNLNGITNWGIGDWVLFNGTVWQRVEGGADGNFNNLTSNSLTVNLPDNAGVLFQAPNDSSTTFLKFGDTSSAYAGSISYDHYTDAFRFKTINIEAMRIDTSQNVSIVTGNLIIGTSGKGIDFSATSGTGTSELFDDYEEGTWTPTLLGSSSNPTVTYGLQRGLYTKVGRLVTITCNLGWSAYSGGSGNAYVGNFPFSIEGATGAYGGAAISAADNITYVASRDNLGLFLLSGTTSARLQCFGSGTTTQTIVTSSVGSTGQLVFSASYQI